MDLHHTSNGGVQAQSRSARPSSSAAHGQVQACQRCRQQKLRCSREQPTCKRCQRASAVCIYPPPPDRKLLAAQRAKKSKTQPYQASVDSEVAPHDQQAQPGDSYIPFYDKHSPLTDRRPDESHILNHHSAVEFYHEYGPQVMCEDPPVSVVHDHGDPRQPAVPSPEVAVLLIEIYFTRAYNATLLFHKETFLSDFSANRVPNFVSFSIFALASIFLPRPSRQPTNDNSEIELGISALSISDCSSYAHEWATVATQQVLVQAVEPRLETVQACQTLGLYWFSMNRIDRTHILTLFLNTTIALGIARDEIDLAYTTCRLLGYHIQQAEQVDGDRLQQEVKRRAFWSCWITSCISQENACFKAESWSEVIGLPFPSDEGSFTAAKPESKEFFGEGGIVLSIDGSESSPHNSIMGEIVKLFSLWWEIQRFVKLYSGQRLGDARKRVQAFLSLDRRLEVVFENLHPDFKYSGPSSFTSVKLDPYKLFLLHCLYRLCGSVLHSSMVPLFSNAPSDPDVSKKLVRMCAEESVKHSMMSLDIANALLSTRPDKSRLSSITGYAMFVSSTIQVRSLSAQGKLKTHQGHLRGAVSIIKQVKEYWSPLQGMWTQLQSIFSSAGLDLNSLAATKNRVKSPPPVPQTDIEQIVCVREVPRGGTSTDIYTYVEDQEPKASTPHGSIGTQPSPGDTSGHKPSISKGMNATVEGLHKRKSPTASIGSNARSTKASGASLNINPPILRPSFSQPAYSASQQHHGQQSFDPQFETNTANILRHNSSSQFQPSDHNTQHMQSHVALLNQHSRVSRGDDISRPIIEGFEMMSDMMAMEMGTDENDFWWTRSFDGMEPDPLGVLSAGYFPTYP